MHECQDHKLCVDKAVRDAEMVCSENGLRLTDLRREVLKLIWVSHIPAKAYDILEMLKGKAWSAKPPTVYRALDFLLESGLVHKLDSISAYVGCSHPREHSNCFFLICSDCSEAKEYCSPEISGAIERAGIKNKFTPKKVTVEVLGRCAECK